MAADLIRALAPVGEDRTIVTARGAIYCTIVEYGTGVVIVGSHPHLYTIPMTDIEDVKR